MNISPERSDGNDWTDEGPDDVNDLIRCAVASRTPLNRTQPDEIVRRFWEEEARSTPDVAQPIPDNSERNTVPQPVSTNQPIGLRVEPRPAPSIAAPVTRSRARRVRPVGAALAVAAAIALSVYLAQHGRAHVPEYPARTAPASGTIGGPSGRDGPARVIVWSLPDHLGGSVAYLNVRPDGTAEVQPHRDALCEPVPVPRPAGPPELKVLFGPDARGDTVVWLLLTDRPGAEALAAVLGAYPRADLRGAHLPDAVLIELKDRGFTVRAVGRVVIPPPELTEGSHP